jgi:hypothetical protein
MATLLLTPGLTYRELSIVAPLHRHQPLRVLFESLVPVNLNALATAARRRRGPSI